jgi:hypothetical protein
VGKRNGNKKREMRFFLPIGKKEWALPLRFFKKKAKRAPGEGLGFPQSARFVFEKISRP